MSDHDFSEIKLAVEKQFKRMTHHHLFRTGTDKDAMWTTYLTSFPEGSNPVFRKRTEHDCSCCRQFIRTIGNVVAVMDGKLTTIWDVKIADPAYQAVASAMAEIVKSSEINNKFLHTEGNVGTDRNREDTEHGVKTWEHFFLQVPNSRVVKGEEIGPKLSDSRATHDVLLRGLKELKLDAIKTTLELIDQNSLYRGEEHKFAVGTFHNLKVEFDKLPEPARDPFVWNKIGDLAGSVSRLLNTSIGTLISDLSNGRDMESAVRVFESMVAPANYKRPTALVTKSMIENAKKTIGDLGLTSALERRFATLQDITVNNILYANRNAKTTMTGNVFDDITPKEKPKTFDKVEEVGIEKFLSDIVPKAETIELLVENRLTNHFVSLIAPTDPDAGLMFKWDNRFGWSYSGDFADSIRERVKKAGGNVTGDLCCRLAWFNRDDLDFHMVEPGHEIYFMNKRQRSPSGGMLDVDMNAGSGETREPVENIYYESMRTMREGSYKLFVHQFAQRELKDIGFEVEIDIKGTLHRFSYDRAVKTNEKVIVAQFKYTRDGGVEILSSLPSRTVSKKVWNVDTENFHKVNVLMFSPNHWDGHGVGNRHYFFMLEGCQNDGTARGFYNEFLRGDLDQHRKVLEIVGSKMRADESPDQLSGLGFSSTQHNHAIVRVTGAFTRTVRVNF